VKKKPTENVASGQKVLHLLSGRVGPPEVSAKRVVARMIRRSRAIVRASGSDRCRRRSVPGARGRARRRPAYTVSAWSITSDAGMRESVQNGSRRLGDRMLDGASLLKVINSDQRRTEQ
jgi:hypothetical protein